MMEEKDFIYIRKKKIEEDKKVKKKQEICKNLYKKNSTRNF